jgi:hypothetical protein
MIQQQQPFGWLWNARFKEMEQQRRINSSSTSNTNQYHTASTQQNQVTTTRLTDSTLMALVKSLSSLIDYNNGGGTTTPKPISLDNIKSYLAQKHNLTDPLDVEAVIEAFKQTYPQVKIATLEEAIQALYRDQTIINTIVRELLNNELAGGSKYTSDDLVKVIRQKFPSANDVIINAVLNNLAAQIARVASVTRGTYDKPVTYWQNRKYHNPVDTFDRNSFLYRPKLFGSQ